MYRNAHAPGRKSSASKSDTTNCRTDDALAAAGRGSVFPESEATPQFLREAKDSFRLVEEVRWQLSGARHTAAGNQKGERRGVYQFGVPPKTALRDSAFLRREASPQVVSEAKDNMVGFALANGSMSSNQSGDCPARSASSKPKAKPQSLPRQRDIRRALIEADLVDCMVALPGQLFYSTQIPVCLWFLAKNKAADAKRGFRDRRHQSSIILQQIAALN
jgi:hypothetical protein